MRPATVFVPRGQRFKRNRPKSASPGINALGTIGAPYNKELERTRSTHFAVSPRRSIQCSAYLEVRTHLNGRTIAVDARTGQMEPRKYFSGKGPGSEPGRSTLRMLAYRYEAAKRRPSVWAEKRSSFRRLISIGAAPSASFLLCSGWPGPIDADHWAATRQHVSSSLVLSRSRGTDNVVSSIGDGKAVETCGNEHVAKISRTPNKPLHQTRRGGVLASRAVVEARLAGERRCYACPRGGS